MPRQLSLSDITVACQLSHAQYLLQCSQCNSVVFFLWLGKAVSRKSHQILFDPWARKQWPAKYHIEYHFHNTCCQLPLTILNTWFLLQNSWSENLIEICRSWYLLSAFVSCPFNTKCTHHCYLHHHHHHYHHHHHHHHHCHHYGHHHHHHHRHHLHHRHHHCRVH